MLLYTLFFLSGVAGLGYQIAWTRMFTTGLGHEMPAVLAVVGSFFVGLALGAWLLDGAISRSGRPVYWYAGLELVIGLWGVVTIVLIPWFNGWAVQWIGTTPSWWRHWGIAFAVPMTVLLPATVAMGATLPAMERAVAPLTPDGRCVGGLYAVNTMGAVVGTLLSAFLIVRWMGYQTAVLTLAVVNLICAAGVVAVVKTDASRPTHGNYLLVDPAAGNGSRWRIGLCVFTTGLLGIGYEVLGVRVMSQILENTVYSFAAALSVYLVGTAIGAAVYQRYGHRYPSDVMLGYLMCGLATTCLLGASLLSVAMPVYIACGRVIGVTGAELIVAAGVFGLPTLFMGATFSHLVQSARAEGYGVGWASSLNTLGGGLAPLLFGVVLLPMIGARWSLTAVALMYMVLIPSPGKVSLLAQALPIVLAVTMPAHLRQIKIGEGQKVLDYREGVMAAVAVIEDARGDRRLRVNNRFQMGGTGAAVAERRQGHIPLLLHPDPKRALFLGVASGITFGSSAFHPGLKADGVELVPEILDLLNYFEPDNQSPQRQSGLKLHVGDARRYVRACEERYDVIIADLFHPARDGAGALYTHEHFQAVRDRLTAGGLFCQWLPLYQLDEPVLRVIARTFAEVFPYCEAYLCDISLDTPALGLVGSIHTRQYGPGWIEQRVNDPRLLSELRQADLATDLGLLGRLVLGPQQLREWAGQAAINTDDHPVVVYEAPRFYYDWSTRYSPGHQRMMAMLDRLPADPSGLIPGVGDSYDVGPLGVNLGQYIRARDIYLHGLAAESQKKPREAITAFVDSTRLSLQFTRGYERCVEIAQVVSKTDPASARRLLAQLVEVRPDLTSARISLGLLSRSVTSTK